MLQVNLIQQRLQLARRGGGSKGAPDPRPAPACCSRTPC